jgi:putative NADH-flavin reductase
MIARRLLVLGATGGTGQQLVTQALAQGHAVTVLVRDPQRMPVVSERLRVLAGSVTGSGPALNSAVRDQDVVISALGVGKSFKSGALIAESTPRIIRAMEDHGIRRLIMTSAFGVGETRRDVPLVPRIFIRLLLSNVYDDKAAGDAQVRSCALDWTVVYPSGLGDGPATGQYRAGERLALRGFPRIARADLAAFLLAQIDDTTYLRKGVLVSS